MNVFGDDLKDMILKPSKLSDLEAFLQPYYISIICWALTCKGKWDLLILCKYWLLRMDLYNLLGKKTPSRNTTDYLEVGTREHNHI